MTTINQGVVLVDESESIRVLMDGDCLFDGSKAELRNVLEQHGKFMDYIDQHKEGGEP